MPDDILIVFLRDWLNWAGSGAPERGPYSRASGLCVSVYRFNPRPYLPEYAVEAVENFRMNLSLAVSDQLQKDFNGDRMHPFNNGDWERFKSECTAYACHLNERRLKWAYAKVEEYDANRS